MKHKNKEARKQTRLEQLGSNHPVCVICGEDDWRCLELHHLEGQAYGDDLVPVCRNCHRKLSDDQKDHPNCPPNASQSHFIGYLLLGLADFFSLLVPSLRRYGKHLIQDQPTKEGSK